MSNKIFLKDESFYQRSLNPIQQYIEQTSFYIAKLKNKDINDVREQLVNLLNNDKTLGIKDPKVIYFERNEQGDKHISSSGLLKYINTSICEDQLIVPTFTTYLPTKTKQSFLSGYVNENKIKRNKAKKEAFKAESEGNNDLFIIKNNEQTNTKLKNNSISGAFAATGSVLNNPTGHNTLTSITRKVSSLSNASNEKLIAGNRHYFNPDVTLYNIISIVSSLDLKEIDETISLFNLVYPSIKETIECVRYSTSLYWNDIIRFKKIEDFIYTLTPTERAGFVYIGDLFHIRKYNDSFVRNLLTKLSRKCSYEEIENINEPLDVESCIRILKTTDDQIINLAHHICFEQMKGKGKDYETLQYKDLVILTLVILNIIETINEYKVFINTFFLTINVPASTSNVPNLIRRTVVLSDTDSTMFAIDEYVVWYFGELIFTNEAMALATSVMFIATQCMAHILAIFSANMGVDRKKLFELEMKPEFTFPVFIQTSVAKHYYTCIAVKEGNVFSDLMFEHKGVHLKNSATPKDIITEAQNKMNKLLTTILDNKKISIIDEIKDVLRIEDKIKTSIVTGEITYYKKSKIKSPEAYVKVKEQSPYLHHIFWNEVWRDKYGEIQEPPYDVIKIPTIIKNITEVNRWLVSIKDEEIRDKLAIWLKQNNKTNLPTIYISSLHAMSYGIPKEIIPIISIKRIVLDLTLTNRIILESLGYFSKHNMVLGDYIYQN